MQIQWGHNFTILAPQVPAPNDVTHRAEWGVVEGQVPEDGAHSDVRATKMVRTETLFGQTSLASTLDTFEAKYEVMAIYWG